MRKSSDKVFSVKSKRGKIVRIVREHYLRSDIFCQSKACKKCQHENPLLPTSIETQHYAIVDPNTLVDFLELFEQFELQNIIVPQTILLEVQERGSIKTYQRVREIANDARRNCVVFCNENFVETFVPKDQPGVTMDERNKAAILRAALWYQEHLPSSCGIHIVLVSEDHKMLQRAKELGVKGQTLGQYLQNYHPSNPNLFELYDSIASIVDLQEAAAEAGVPTGYEEYKSDDVLEAGVKSGIIFRGKLTLSRINMDEAWVKVDQKSALGHDVFISNKTLRNRAINGDIVAVELLDRKFWVAPSTSMKEREDDAASNAEAPRAQSDIPCGRVVGVFTRNWRPFVCTIAEEDLQEAKKDKAEWVTAIPWDYKIPKIRIRTRQLGQIANSRIVVRLDKWDVSSNNPQGHYVRTIGEIGKLDTEVQVLMQENGIDYAPFSGNMLAELPENTELNPWKIDPEELKTRRDCRSWRVMSIDPIGSQDIDDALNVNVLPNGNLQVGVHIADVNAFVKEDSLLDTEARARSTSVYLADRRIDMLPALLSERLCSIRQGEDRYAVSVVWEFDSEANIVDTWYGRTVIHSRYELNYQQAQDIYDNKQAERDKLKEDFEPVKQDITHLMKIYRKLRDRRLAKGALELESVELRFELDKDKRPVNIKTKADIEMMAMVAEYMITANVAVAEFLYKQFPSCALLRRHTLPRLEAFEELIRLAHEKGFNIDTSSNKSLATSLSAAVTGDKTFNHLLKSLATLAMAEAEYFSTGQHESHEFYHYGLAADYYTHFTSPIRRYADVLVHRQLIRALAGQPPPLGNNQLQEVAEHINEKHRQAKQVQRDSSELFQVLYFKDRNIAEDAVIYNFKNNGFLVYIQKFGLKAPLYLRDTSGKLMIPPTALTLDPSNSKHVDRVVDGFTVDEERTQMTLSTSKGAVAVKLLDHVMIKINVLESRSHLPPVKLELISLFGEDAHKDDATLGPRRAGASNVGRIDIKAELIKAQRAANAPVVLPRTEFSQSMDKNSFYVLVEQLSQLDIEDKKMLNKVPGVLSFRQAKSRRAFQENKLKHHLRELGYRQQYGDYEEEDEYEEEEDERSKLPIGGLKVGTATVSSASKSAAPLSSLPARLSAPATASQSFSPSNAPGSSSSSSSSSSPQKHQSSSGDTASSSTSPASVANTSAPALSAPKKQSPSSTKPAAPGRPKLTFTPKPRVPSSGSGSGVSGTASMPPSVEKVPLGDRPRGVETKYRDTISRAEQEAKAKAFAAAKAKRKFPTGQ